MYPRDATAWGGGGAVAGIGSVRVALSPELRDLFGRCGGDPRLLSMLVEVQYAVTSAAGTDPAAALRAAAEGARLLCGTAGASIELMAGDRLVLRATAGSVPADLERPSYHDDYERRDDRLPRAAPARADSTLSVPIAHEGRIAGTLTVRADAPDAPGPREDAALRLLAGLLAPGIARLADGGEVASRHPPADWREADERFRAAFEHAAIGMALVGLDGRWLKVNRALCDILDYAEGELLGTSFQALTHPDDLAADVALVRRLLAGELRDYQMVKRYLHRDGHAVWAHLNVSLVRDAAGRPLYFVSQVQDVTDRKRAEWLEGDSRAVVEMVARHEPLDDVLAGITALVERQVPGAAAAVFLLEEGSLRLVAPHLPTPFADALRVRSLSLAHALCNQPDDAGGAPPTGFQEVTLSRMDSDPAWQEPALREAATAACLGACWSVAVRCSEGVFLGMLMLFLRPPAGGRLNGEPAVERVAPRERPGPGDTRMLQMAARAAAIAVEHRQSADRLAHRAHHDVLTGLPNRMLFDDRLHHALAMARRTGRCLGLLAIDLDRFKQVNDTYGHAAGDDLLQQFAHRVRTGLRESDTLARVGGDEFVAILTEVDRRDDAVVVARRVVDLLAEPFEVAGRVLPVTGSVGVAVWPDDGDDAATLQRRADAAMYAAKAAGRNGFACATATPAGTTAA